VVLCVGIACDGVVVCCGVVVVRVVGVDVVVCGVAGVVRGGVCVYVVCCYRCLLRVCVVVLLSLFVCVCV